jgi:hypothetical protein
MCRGYIALRVVQTVCRLWSTACRAPGRVGPYGAVEQWWGRHQTVGRQEEWGRDAPRSGLSSEAGRQLFSPRGVRTHHFPLKGCGVLHVHRGFPAVGVVWLSASACMVCEVQLRTRFSESLAVCVKYYRIRSLCGPRIRTLVSELLAVCP